MAPDEYLWLAAPVSELLNLCTMLSPAELKLFLIILCLQKDAGGNTTIGGHWKDEPTVLSTNTTQLVHFFGAASRSYVRQLLKRLEKRGLLHGQPLAGKGLLLAARNSVGAVLTGSLGRVGAELVKRAGYVLLRAVRRPLHLERDVATGVTGSPRHPGDTPGAIEGSKGEEKRRNNVNVRSGYMPASEQVQEAPGARAVLHKRFPPELRGLTCLTSDLNFLVAYPAMRPVLEPLGGPGAIRAGLGAMNSFLLTRKPFAVKNWPAFVGAFVRRRLALERGEAGRQRQESHQRQGRAGEVRGRSKAPEPRPHATAKL